MGKKKHSKHARNERAPGWGETGYGAMGGMGNGFAPSDESWDARGGPSIGNPAMDGGFLHSLQGLAGSRSTEQFILGALIGAAAVYVLGDEEMRGKLVKTGMRLYAGIAGGFEEIKEQMADIRAEVAAEQSDSQ